MTGAVKGRDDWTSRRVTELNRPASSAQQRRVRTSKLPATPIDGSPVRNAGQFARLLRHDHSRILVTPCGILAPLIDAIDGEHCQTISREDIAIGLATGFALGGARTAVLMQNSGLGQSINALASLACPYNVPMTLVVSLRGTDNDTTAENAAMGRVTEPLLKELGIPTTILQPRSKDLVTAYDELARASRTGPAAILVPPTAFGWAP